VVVFTKFDGQIINEYVTLMNPYIEDKWEMARNNAEHTFQEVYLPKVLDAKYPPKAYVRLEDMDLPEKHCPELAQQTADAIDDESLHHLFVSTQKNNLDLCVKAAFQAIINKSNFTWEDTAIVVLSKFPHYWFRRQHMSATEMKEIQWFETAKNRAKSYSHEDHYFAFGYFRGAHGPEPTKGIFPKGHAQQRHEFGKEIFGPLLSLFGDVPNKFSITPTACQVLISMNIIAKLSFWIGKPFRESVMKAFEKFKREGYVQKLKMAITLQAINLSKEDLVVFMCQHVI